MTPWQSELFDDLRGADAARVQSLVARATNEMGFTWFEYGLWHALPLSNPGLQTLGNTPTRWRQRYGQQRHVLVDPVVAHARRSREPLVWDDEVFEAHPALACDARQHGVNHGWTLATVNHLGQRGMFTVCRADPPLRWEEAQASTSNFSWLAYMAHLFLAELAARQRAADDAVELTPREAEVLRWTGDGKTSADISSILNISNDTVNFHLRNAMQKLNANSRTSAVVTALMQGLLTL